MTYHYEDARFPGLLTGKSYNGVRYSYFAYDEQGRAISTEHAGGVEPYRYSYNTLSKVEETSEPFPFASRYLLLKDPNAYDQENERIAQSIIQNCANYFPGGLSCTTDGKTVTVKRFKLLGPFDVTETSPLGRQTTYRFENGHQTDVTGTQTQHCAASFKTKTYDRNGYVDIASDFENNLTDFDYDAQGHLLQKTAAKGSSAERTTLYTWDTEHNRLLGETVVGYYADQLTYDADGRVLTRMRTDLTAVGHGQTQRTQYTYTKHPNGLLASVVIDGPLAGSGDQITETYSDAGDLLTVSNGAGHQTTFSNYNALGLPGQITGPNGETVQFIYDARGRELNRSVVRNGAKAVTTTTYDGAENVRSVQQPDGVTQTYTYDAARRLVGVDRVRSDGTAVHEQIDYNRASQVEHRKTFDSGVPDIGRIIGIIDGVTLGSDGQYAVNGWTCVVGSDASLNVDVYVIGVGKIASGVANLASDASATTACQAKGTAYRYSFKVPAALAKEAIGKGFNIYAFSPKNYDPTLLKRSGEVTVPSDTMSGRFAGLIHDSEWNYSIAGWVCAPELADSVNVELWVGGGPGVGKLLKTVTANGSEDGDQSAACHSQVGNRSFRYALTPSERTVYGGQSVYAVAKSVGSPIHDLNMGDSATQRVIPAMDRFDAWVSWTKLPYDRRADYQTLQIRVRNTGNVMWGATKDSGHHFLYVFGQSNLTQQKFSWNLELPHAVAPGDTATIEWNVPIIKHSRITPRLVYTLNAQMRVDALGFGDTLTQKFTMPISFAKP